MRVSGNIEILKERALFLRDEGLAAIADLHLGFEGVLQKEGISIPRRQKGFMLDALTRIIERRAPETILINGDFKHDFSRNLDEEWLEVKEVLRFLDERAKIVIVRGNHDNYLATILRDFNIELRKSYTAGGFVFAHGHWDIKTSKPFIIGHEHPALKLRDEVGAMISLPTFVVSEDVIVLPAFSPLALGADVSARPFLSPVLRSRNITDARLFGVDEKEGIMDFGYVAEAIVHGAYLTMK